MAKTVTLEQALKKLDTKNADHWTADGLPRMDVLHEMTGNSELTRAEVSKAAPNFTKDNPSTEKGEAPAPSGTTAQGTDADPNPTMPGETNDEIKGDDTQENVREAKPGGRQDADGTLTASAENDRNEGRSDEALHVDADGEPTASRENEQLAGTSDMPPPQNADGSITSNRQTNDEDAARRAGFEPDSADEEMNELERTNPDDASDKDQGEIDDLDAELAKLDEQLAAEEEELNERRRRAERVRAQRDALVERRDRKVDPQADMKDRLAFIKRQTAARAERAGDDRLARELAMQSRGIGSSPLDQSLATRPRPRRDLPKAE